MALLKACITSATFLPHLRASGNQVFKVTHAELCPFSCNHSAKQGSPVTILSVCLCEGFFCPNYREGKRESERAVLISKRDHIPCLILILK